MTYILAPNARLAELIARYLRVRHADYRYVRDPHVLQGLRPPTKLHIFYPDYRRDFTEAQWDAAALARIAGLEFIEVTEDDLFGRL